MDSAAIIAGYDDAAEALFDAYDAISSSDLLRPVADLLPSTPARIADIGAGNGRDAAWLSAQGHEVVAVEPAQAMRDRAAARHAGANVRWLDDALPLLPVLTSHGQSFGCILLSGVWQHLDSAARIAALPVLRSFLESDTAVLVISFRHCPGAPTRPCFDLPLDNTLAAAARAGLTLVRQCETASLQPGNRAAGVTWTWLVFSPT